MINPRARRLIGATLTTAFIVGASFWLRASGAPWSVVAVLIVACLCALALDKLRRTARQPIDPTYWGERALFARLVASAPECARFPNPAARRAAILEIVAQLQGSWWCREVAALVGLAILVLARRPSTWLTAVLPFLSQWIAYGAVVLIGLAAFFPVLWLRVRHRVRLDLRERLVALGVPVCLHCGYDLRGQTDPRCPECGRPFDAALLQPPGTGGH
jgi:hypothetical protein